MTTSTIASPNVQQPNPNAPTPLDQQATPNLDALDNALNNGQDVDAVEPNPFENMNIRELGNALDELKATALDQQLEANYIESAAYARRKAVRGSKALKETSQKYFENLGAQELVYRTILAKSNSREYFGKHLDKVDASTKLDGTDFNGTTIKDKLEAATDDQKDEVKKEAIDQIMGHSAVAKAIELERAIVSKQYEMARGKERGKLATYALGKWASWNTTKFMSTGTLKKAAVGAAAGVSVGLLTVATLPAVGAALVAPVLIAGRVARGAGKLKMDQMAAEFRLSDEDAEQAAARTRERSIDQELAFKEGAGTANLQEMMQGRTNKERSKHKKRAVLVGGVAVLSSVAGHALGNLLSGDDDSVDGLGATSAEQPKPDRSSFGNGIPMPGNMNEAPSPANPGTEGTETDPADRRSSFGNGIALSNEALFEQPDATSTPVDGTDTTPSTPATTDDSGIVGTHNGPKGGEADQFSTITIAQGDGFEDSLQKQYDLTDAQASQVYADIQSELQGTPDTYAINGDPTNIGISRPGVFQFNAATRAALERALEDLEDDEEAA